MNAKRNRGNLHLKEFQKNNFTRKVIQNKVSFLAVFTIPQNELIEITSFSTLLYCVIASMCVAFLMPILPMLGKKRRLKNVKKRKFYHEKGVQLEKAVYVFLLLGLIVLILSLAIWALEYAFMVSLTLGIVVASIIFVGMLLIALFALKFFS